MTITSSQVLVIGAGPAGLAASKCLNDENVNNELVDRYGDPGGSYLRMYGRMHLSSPPRYLTLPGAKPPQLSGYLRVSDYVTYLRKYADDNKIYPVRREVSRVEWNGTSFEVTFTDDVSKYNYEFVVICTGSFDKPNLPTIPGLNDGISAETKTISFSHACSWIGPEQFASSRLLIFGGGMTAIELAEECVRFGIRPFLSFRAGRGKTFPHQIFGIDPRFLVYPIMRRIPIKVFHRQCTKGWAYRGIDRGFKEFCSQGLIDVRPLIKSVSGPLVTFTDHSSAEVDHVVFATGYRWDMPFLPSSIPTAMQGNPILKRGESIACPGLFCVGVTCAFNASSHFIHGVLEDAKRVASLIAERKTTAFPTHQR